MWSCGSVRPEPMGSRSAPAGLRLREGTAQNEDWCLDSDVGSAECVGWYETEDGLKTINLLLPGLISTLISAFNQFQC